ncbi:MAG: PilN domain-containing protein [Chromatiales bacterium]|nr:PilN domain-containing protein [Chromatiales bacterium]
MARINLLPWRENLRKERQREFGMMALAGVLVSAAVCLGVTLYIEGMISYQEQRNNYLKSEIKIVDRQIKEIKELEKTKANLIARMNVIQDLQVSRPQIVHLFDELVDTIPDGSYLTRLTQQGANLTLEGRSQSNARVSAYMRNIEASKWIGKPNLQVVSTKQADGVGMNDFELNAQQLTKASGEEDQL